jgi:hypothetical protein
MIRKFKFVSLASVALITLCAVSTWPALQGFGFGTLSNSHGNVESAHRIQPPAAQETGAQIDATSCVYTFTSGNAQTYMKYCVTVNGNIVQFQSPLGVEDIKSATSSEGYGLCTDGGSNSYWDWAEAGAQNWGKATLLNQTATEVKIARTTTDGIWTLTQTITQNSSGPYAKIEMQLKNDTDVSQEGGFFMRWADVNADNSTINNLDATTISAWGYRPFLAGSSYLPYGLLLENFGVNTNESAGYALDTNQPPEVCEPGLTSNGTLTATDGSIMMLYVFPPVAKNQTVAFNAKYAAF